MTPICRHCRDAKRPVNRPRGLCWYCFYTPGVKELYPTFAPRSSVGIFRAGFPAPPIPTTAAPGTPEKLAVLEKRARDGQHVFHPADARYEGDPRPLEFLRARA